MDNKTNKGTAFTNDKTKDTQPDFKGELNVEGKIYQLAVWKKVAKNNKPYLSISIEDKSKYMTNEQVMKVAEPTKVDYLDDDIGF